MRRGSRILENNLFTYTVTDVIMYLSSLRTELGQGDVTMFNYLKI